jgi:hypothetical protein
MRQLGVAPLHVLELGDALLSPAGMEQRQPVIQFFPHGIRRQIESLFEFHHRFSLGGGVFVKSSAQVAVLRQRSGNGGRVRRPEQ